MKALLCRAIFRNSIFDSIAKVGLSIRQTARLRSLSFKSLQEPSRCLIAVFLQFEVNISLH